LFVKYKSATHIQSQGGIIIIIMGNRSSESSGQVAPSDVEADGGAGQSGRWSSWMRLPGMSGEEPDEDPDPCQFMNLTLQQRAWGFGICFALGTVISIMSSFLVLNPAKFALPYSLGNILSIMSTGFLVGPRRQCKYACQPIRIWAFLIFIGAVICTLISALVLKKAFLTLLFVCVQFLAGIWYTASYIPYGREMLKSCANACVGQATAQVTGE